MTNTLQPFHDELDNLLMGINRQARYMEDLANIKLAYTCEQLNHDWARRDRFNEPWHFQYHSKVLGKWPWYSRFRWLDRLVSWVWRVRNR